MTRDEKKILSLEVRIKRLKEIIRVYESHINVTCERCGREASKRFNGDEYHLHNDSNYCDDDDVEQYQPQRCNN